jgi:hypothetical protein
MDESFFDTARQRLVELSVADQQRTDRSVVRVGLGGRELPWPTYPLHLLDG